MDVDVRRSLWVQVLPGLGKASDHLKNRRAMTCAPERYSELKIPSEPAPPYFTPLRCSLQPRVRSRNGVRGTIFYPFSINKCQHCGWDGIAPTDCSFHMSENEFSWVDKQSVNGEDLFAEVSGTGAQFMERVKEVPLLGCLTCMPMSF